MFVNTPSFGFEPESLSSVVGHPLGPDDPDQSGFGSHSDPIFSPAICVRLRVACKAYAVRRVAN